MILLWGSPWWCSCYKIGICQETGWAHKSHHFYWLLTNTTLNIFKVKSLKITFWSIEYNFTIKLRKDDRIFQKDFVMIPQSLHIRYRFLCLCLLCSEFGCLSSAIEKFGNFRKCVLKLFSLWGQCVWKT